MSEKFDIKKILYPVLAAVIIGVASFTARAVIATQELKTEQKRLDKEIQEIKAEVKELDETTVSNDTFNGLCKQIESMNESLKLIEKRTYDLWKKSEN